MKRDCVSFFGILFAQSGLCIAAFTQAPPRLAGFAPASEFGHWSAHAQGPILGTGQPEGFTLEGAEAIFTLPDGKPFSPLAVGDPLLISGDGNVETVVASGVSCPSGGQACSVSADFSKPHPGGFTVSSGSYGLQEAINYEASHGGGIAEADAGFGGSVTALLPNLKLPNNVLLIDATNGNWNYYGLGNGGSPSLIASFSSASGASVNQALAATLRTLNGAVFAALLNFPANQPGGSLAGGTPATVTPAWALPLGVIAGDTLYISGGAGTAEAVVLTSVGVACPSGTSASVCFTPANSHSGAWMLASATNGLQEAITLAGAGGWVIDDIPVAELHAPLVLMTPVRLTGFSAMDASVGTQLVQNTASTDVIQVGTAATKVQDAVIEHLMAVGVSGSGSDTGVAIHCVNCAKLKLDGVTAKNAHDGLFLDSAAGAAFDATVTGSHFIGNFYGVHIVGGSANRDTFVGNTVDQNAYGVFDDGGWVHTWVGNDIESNTQYGYWQQVSQPANWSGHNIVLHGDYFERNGSASGQGDVFLGQLVGGGSGNNGAGCINCEVTDCIFNATTGGNVTALNLGAVAGSVANNTYSGYGTGKQYATITGPTPNFTEVLALGDCAVVNGTGCGTASSPGTITRLDANGTLTLGGSDQLLDQFGTRLKDTTIESPTGKVSIRGTPGGAASSNGALLALEGNSTSVKSNEIKWRNAGVDEWGIKNDVAAGNAHDFCLANDYAIPTSATCDLYLNQQKHFRWSASGIPGNITFDADYRFLQQANGDPAIQVLRFTDTSPTGYLIDLEDSTESHPLFRVDALGDISTVAGTANITGAVTMQSTLAVTGAITEGGNAVNVTAPRVSGQSGPITSGTYTAGSCITGGISFGSGVAIGMAVASNPETTPPAGLMWNAYIDSANHVTIRVCNATSSSIVWSAGSVWDVRVLP